MRLVCKLFKSWAADSRIWKGRTLKIAKPSTAHIARHPAVGSEAIIDISDVHETYSYLCSPFIAAGNKFNEVPTFEYICHQCGSIEEDKKCQNCGWEYCDCSMAKCKDDELEYCQECANKHLKQCAICNYSFKSIPMCFRCNRFICIECMMILYFCRECYWLCSICKVKITERFTCDCCGKTLCQGCRIQTKHSGETFQICAKCDAEMKRIA